MRWVLEEFKLWSDNRVTGVFTADPEGNMIDMEQNPSYSCRGVPFEKHKCRPHGAREKVVGLSEVSGCSIRELEPQQFISPKTIDRYFHIQSIIWMLFKQIVKHVLYVWTKEAMRGDFGILEIVMSFDELQIIKFWGTGTYGKVLRQTKVGKIHPLRTINVHFHCRVICWLTENRAATNDTVS